MNELMLQIEKEAESPTPFEADFMTWRLQRWAMVARPTVGNAFSIMKYRQKLAQVPSAEQQVAQAYLDILKRRPDVAGLNYYCRKIKQHGLTAVVFELYFSREHQSAIARSSLKARLFWWAQRGAYTLWSGLCRRRTLKLQS